MSLVARRVIVPSFTGLPEFFYGKGSLSVLRNITAENILLLVSKSVQQTETYQKVIEKYFATKTVNSEIIQNPVEQTILDISTKYRAWPPDTVIAMGGGAVLDSAKIIRHLLSFPESTLESLQNTYVNESPRIRLLSVPTTPNTGSESNITAVITNRNGIKVPFINKTFLPTMAVLDPTFLSSIRPSLMEDFIADIFTHAYEGSMSRLGTPYMQILADVAIQKLVEGVQKYKQNPQDMEALELIQYAGQFAGIVAGNAYVGVIHALGHALESMTGGKHGECLHLLLAPCLTWQEQQNNALPRIKHYKKIWDEFGLIPTANNMLVKHLDVQQWAERAFNDPSLKTDAFRIKNIDQIQEIIQWVQSTV